MKKAGYAWFRIRNYMKEKLHSGHRFLTDESGMGTVELILIIVVLIGLVIIFKKQLTSLVNTILRRLPARAMTFSGNRNTEKAR